MKKEGPILTFSERLSFFQKARLKGKPFGLVQVINGKTGKVITFFQCTKFRLTSF